MWAMTKSPPKKRYICDVNGNVGQFGGAFDYHGYITPIVTLWYIFTEPGSIIENAVKLSDRVPPFLRKLIDKLKNTAGKGMAGENEKNDK